MSSSVAPIDARGPRWAAWITSTLLLITVALGLTGLSSQRATASFGWFAYQPLASEAFFPGMGWAVSSAGLLTRVSDPAFILLVAIAALFLWGLLSPRTQPWSVLFRRVIAPRLSPAHAWEDPRPPRFAQGVGLFVTGVGVVLHLLGVPLAIPIAAGAAFVAAFLNAAFGVCLGCMMYLGLLRFRRRSAGPPSHTPSR